MPQFRVQPADVDEREGRAILRGAEAHHLTRVLRLGAGETVLLFDGAGRRWAGVIERTGPEVVVAGLTSRAANESPVRLALVVALPKGERWDRVLEKGTELGVSAFRPVYTERTVVRLSPGQEARRLERWRRIVEAAAKQCERGALPEVFPPVPIADALGGLGPPGPDEVRVVWAERSLERLAPPPGGVRRAMLASGPEGGWTEHELGLLRKAGFRPAGLGPRILRAETAAVVGAALAQFWWGDLNG